MSKENGVKTWVMIVEAAENPFPAEMPGAERYAVGRIDEAAPSLETISDRVASLKRAIDMQAGRFDPVALLKKQMEEAGISSLS